MNYKFIARDRYSFCINPHIRKIISDNSIVESNVGIYNGF